jgi:hydroxymethylglutaryl-CoA lyase
VPNLRGAEAALAAGVHKLTIPVSASAAHSLANVRKTREEMIAEVRSIVALRNERAPQVRIEAGISTAFGCTIQGPVPEDEVVWMAEQVIRAGVDESGLSDTTGMANPAQVRRRFTRVFAAIGDKTGAAHMHNTRGLGLANCLAAWDVGVRTFDSSQGGLGGCPYAPGASGNVVTEARKAAKPDDEYSSGYGSEPAEATGKVVAWLATDPTADKFLGKWIFAPKLCSDLGLLPGWTFQAPQ